MMAALVLAHCNFPPPTTTDDQPRTSSRSSQISSNKEMADTKAQMSSLEEKIIQMQGKLEVVSYELEQLRDAQQDKLQDLDTRIAMLETEATRPDTAQIARSVQVSRDEPVDASNIDLLIKNANMGTNLSPTISGLQTWIEKNPKHRKQKDAQFALAKAYYFQEDHARAIQHFQTVVDNYPKTDEACESIYHQGLSFVALKDNKNAQLFFEEAVTRCPKHEVKAKSEQEIKKITS